MTPEDRASVANGIWLCAACSKIVDTLPDAFPADTLRYWKQNAERAAARDAQLTAYDMDGLIAEIDTLYHAMISFVQEWDSEATPTCRISKLVSLCPILVSLPLRITVIVTKVLTI